MTWQPATSADLPKIEAFLARHVQTSMFMLSNLADHGLAGSAPRSMHIWWAGSGADVTGVFGRTVAGMIMPQMPNHTPGDWTVLRGLNAGAGAIGALGEPGQIRAALAAFGLDRAPTAHDADEPGFTLDLAQLVMPPTDALTLVHPDETDRNTLIAMRTAYHIEVLGTSPRDADQKAAGDIDGYLSIDSHRLLRRGGQPVAMTGFNATWRDTVQIGGVYTPPDLRGQGLARAAVALHLAEVRARGVRRAVLFAANEPAANVYRAIGFRRAGSFTMVLLDGTWTIAS